MHKKLGDSLLANGDRVAATGEDRFAACDEIQESSDMTSADMHRRDQVAAHDEVLKVVKLKV